MSKTGRLMPSNFKVRNGRLLPSSLKVVQPSKQSLPKVENEPVIETAAVVQEQCKNCNHCHQSLPISNFRKSAKGTYGVDCVCKPCRASIYKNRMQDSEYKVKLAKLRADNHVKNREKYNQRHKGDFQKNKQKIYKRRKEFYLANPDKMLAELHRQHLRNILKSGKESSELVGCDKSFLSEWFNFHFSIDTDMSIENHGTYWHIDHVIPVNKWDLSDEEHKKLCFSWRNLMPLKVTDNLSKHDNIDLEQVNEQNRRLKLFSEMKGDSYIETPLYLFQ